MDDISDYTILVGRTSQASTQTPLATIIEHDAESDDDFSDLDSTFDPFDTTDTPYDSNEQDTSLDP